MGRELEEEEEETNRCMWIIYWLWWNGKLCTQLEKRSLRCLDRLREIEEEKLGLTLAVAFELE
jgi:hypothetical protein